LKLMLENNFPRIWVPTPENRDVGQLVLHRHRLVGMRTRVMNQLQAMAMNEGIRRKRGLWTEKGRAQLESLRSPPWTTRRRQELLELLDGFDPRIEQLSQAIEQEAERGRRCNDCKPIREWGRSQRWLLCWYWALRIDFVAASRWPVIWD
jgi:transposase